METIAAEKRSLPIEYRTTILFADGSELTQDLEEPGWLAKISKKDIRVFTLTPVDGVASPEFTTVCVDLTPFPDGDKKELVYFSRVYGRMASGSSENRPLFRIYAVGWKANIGGREVKSLNWIYPSGNVVVADEPLFVDALIEDYSARAAEVPA